MSDERISRHICENCLRLSVIRLLHISLLSFLLFCTSGCSESEEADLNNRCLPIFDSDALLSLDLRTDLTQFLDTKEDDYISAKGILRMGMDTIHSNKFKIKRRGVTRQKICDIPPIMLRFGKKGNRVKFKLVVPCKGGEDYQQLVYKEHLAYQLYGIVTEQSFRTLKVEIAIDDDSGAYPSVDALGFIIEDDKCVADRLEGMLAEKGINMKFIDQEAYRTFTLFQYMIGNTDWNLSRRHNVKLVTVGNSKPIPVPYDFDFAGLVDAPYAHPHENVPVKNVKERYFMWRAKDTTGFEKAIDLYLNKKNDILSAVEDYPDLSSVNKIDIQDYLADFFKELESGQFLSN